MLTVEVFTSRFSRGSNQIIHFQSGTLGPPKREAGNLAIQFGTGSGPGICFTSSQRSVTSCCIRDLRLSVPCNKHHPNARESNRRPPRTAKNQPDIRLSIVAGPHCSPLFTKLHIRTKHCPLLWMKRTEPNAERCRYIIFCATASRSRPTRFGFQLWFRSCSLDSSPIQPRHVAPKANQTGAGYFWDRTD